MSFKNLSQRKIKHQSSEVRAHMNALFTQRDESQNQSCNQTPVRNPNETTKAQSSTQGGIKHVICLSASPW